MPMYFNGTTNNFIGKFCQVFFGNSHLTLYWSMFLYAYVVQNKSMEALSIKRILPTILLQLFHFLDHFIIE